MQEKTHFCGGYLEICRFFRIFAALNKHILIMTQEQKSNTKVIRNEKFGGERPLFATHDLRLKNVTITDGESGIKQCQNIEDYDCKFYGKYPWWHQ